MKTRTRMLSAALALAACLGGGTALSSASQDVPQTGAQTSHRMRSIDQPLQGTKYLKQATIQPAQARALALKVFDGRLIHARLGKQAGGSGLRYVFVIRNDQGETHRVDIDANDGTTLQNNRTHPRR